jgi:MFS superfamily sulfate permease-like transporter
MFHMDTPAVTRRTYGGSLVILGVLVLFVGLFLADSAAMLFKLFPASVLGAILFFGGFELAAGSHGSDLAKSGR